VVSNDSTGRPQPFTVVASGFRPGTLAYLEQCDGAPLNAPGWSPTVHCDLGSAPAPAIVASDGTATFDSRDRNHAFSPFRGESPQSLFNCLAAGDAVPPNRLPTFRNCRVRISSNNSAATDDQAFLAMTLTNKPGTTPSAGPGTSPSEGSSGATNATAGTVSDAPSLATSDTSAVTSSSPASHLAFTGAETLLLIRVGYVVFAVGMVLAALRLTHLAR
jgi:hypothetical protein